jgi:hypothetical protein
MAVTFPVWYFGWVIRRWRILVGIVLVTLFAVVIWRGRLAREPVYEGRTLSSWLDHHVSSSAAVPPYGSEGWNKAEEALRAIGTNGIPVLVDMLRAKDPPKLVMKAAERQGWTRLQEGAAWRRHEEAEYAFHLLGTNAASAVPDLIEIYEKNISQSSQDHTAMSLGHIGAAAQAALPVLIRRFTHTNQEVRFHAVSAVMDIGGDPNVVIPALVSALKDPFVSVRWNALVGLTHFGAKARPIVPEILKMMNDPGMVGSDSITNQVITALWRIAPEKAGHALVVEEATALVENGVTVAPIKALFMGKREILIPAGKTVPAAGQFWDSDPRPKLTYYRGGKNGEDVLLGNFEVVGVPAEKNVNISTLCIVVDGKIFLTARENHSDKILEVRRLRE